MKKLFLTKISLILAASLASAVPAFAMERPEIHFDKKEWKLAARTNKNSILTLVFIPKNEEAAAWSESVTAQYFPGLQARVTPEQYADKIKQGLQSKCPAAEWRIVRALPGDLTYEWSLSACSGVPNQSEIARIIKGNEALHILHYAHSKPEMPAAKKAEWLKLLSDSKLKNDEPPAQV